MTTEGTPVGASVPAGEVLLPALVLSESALENNLEVMATYARDHEFVLAPHGKTTLAPEIFRRQLSHGAWGITAANVAQAAVAFGAGARRVLVANEIASAIEVAEATQLLAMAQRELFCLVDSLAGVAVLERLLQRANTGARLKVLVELGVVGHRSGARSIPAALAVARAVTDAEHLVLAGVEGYEGVISSVRTSDALAVVDAYLSDLGQLARNAVEEGLFRSGTDIIVSAGGSKYFDRVASVLAPLVRELAPGALLVVRAGSYVAHDHGLYAAVSPLAGPRRGGHLRSALELWATVLSVPEPGLAVVGFGKRDASYDAGLPVALHRVAHAAREPEPFVGAEVTALDDQHCYLRFDARESLVVGDRLGFGLSHPCTAFDKWRQVLLVDDSRCVVAGVNTAFH